MPFSASCKIYDANWTPARRAWRWLRCYPADTAGSKKKEAQLQPHANAAGAEVQLPTVALLSALPAEVPGATASSPATDPISSFAPPLSPAQPTDAVAALAIDSVAPAAFLVALDQPADGTVVPATDAVASAAHLVALDQPADAALVPTQHTAASADPLVPLPQLPDTGTALPTDPAASASTQRTDTRSVPVPSPTPRRLTEPVHHQRLREALNERGSHAQPRPRDPAWQRAHRQRDGVIRAELVTLFEQFRSEGVTAQAAAALLGVPERTLRQWRHDLRGGVAEVKILGRPHVRATPEQADQVMTFLHGHGPWVGTPTLRGEFPTVPRAEVRDLLAVYRHLWSSLHPRERHLLDWHRVGAVWALDFHEAKQPIDGLYPYVFAVRDLASGMQLAWLPMRDLTATSVLRELSVLFTIHGAPLVLKSDNGSAFRADELKRFFRPWQVWPLYSPPATPWYNGSIEASIGSLKTRTQFAAYRSGHAGIWTSADLEAAREQSNTTARPRGPRGPTPAETWATRRPPTQLEHDAFTALVRARETAARMESHIALEAVLDHYEQADLHRRVLTQALVEGGFLTITRRRIPQRFFGQKVANIR